MFKKVLFILVLLVVFLPGFAMAARQKVILVPIEYDRGRMSLGGNIEVSNGYVPENKTPVSPFSLKGYLKIFSDDGELLENREFGIGYIISPTPLPGEEQQDVPTYQIERMTHTEILPYYEKGVMLMLFDANQKLLGQKDIRDLLKGCADSKCSKEENDDDIDDNQKNMNGEIELKTDLNFRFLLIGFLVLFIFVFICGGYYLFFKKDKNKDYSDKVK